MFAAALGARKAPAAELPKSESRIARAAPTCHSAMFITIDGRYMSNPITGELTEFLQRRRNRRARGKQRGPGPAHDREMLANVGRFPRFRLCFVGG